MSDDPRDRERLPAPFRLRAPKTPSAPGWPPDVNPNQIIHASHINLIRDSVADWPGDVDGHNHVLKNVTLVNPGGVMVDPMTTAGDLITRGAAATGRFGVGTTGQVLMADTNLPGKLKWAIAPGLVTSVFGRAGAIVAAAGDYTAAQVTGAVDSAGAYADPAWITSLAWGKIVGVPAAGVSSVFGRSGDVTAQIGDYNAAQVLRAVDSGTIYQNPAWIGSLAYNKLTGVPVTFPPSSHVHDAADVITGRFAPARLGTGVADSTVYLRGDGAWAPAGTGGGGGAVTSVFGRAGVVVAQTGDYSVAQVTGALGDPTTAKGDVLVRSAAAVVRIPVGADGQVLQADSAQVTGVRWGTVSGSWIDPTSTKGDLLVRDAVAITRLPVGINTYVLTADSAAPTGIKWAPATGGAGGAVLSVFGRSGDVLAASGDYIAAQVLHAVDDQLAYVNPSWISSLSFSKMTGVPAFVTDPTTTKGDLLARSATAVSRLPVGADGMVLTADSAQLLGVRWAVAGAGGSPQTPWTSDINAAGFRLYSAGNIGIGTATIPISSSIAGRAYLTIKGASDLAVLELATGAADDVSSVLGQLQFVDPLNNQTDKRMASLWAGRMGPTANNHGSFMAFFTRPDGGTAAVERIRIDNAGNVGIGTATIPASIGAANPNRAYLSLKGASDYSMFELTSGAPDADGSGIGQIVFGDPVNPNADKRLAMIYVSRSGTTTNNRGSAMVFTTRPDGATAVAERMRIDNQGRVGIGTASPIARLHSVNTGSPNWNPTVNGLGYIALLADGSYGGGIGIQDGTYTMSIFSNTGVLNFGNGTTTTPTTTRMVIDNAGRVGIGTTSPADILQIRQAAGINLLIQGTKLVTGAISLNAVNDANSANIPLEIRSSLTAFTSGNVGIGTTSPSTLLHVAGASATHAAEVGNLLVTGGGPTFRVGIGFNSTASPIYGWVNAVQNGVAACNLALNPSGGYVGINTTSPQQLLDVQGSTGNSANIRISHTTQANSKWQMGAGGNTNPSPGCLAFYNEVLGQAPIVILPTGLVGIGKSNPGYALDVTGDINCTGAHRVNGVAIGGGGVTTQNVVTGSRANNTVYQNTTGKPMFVVVGESYSGVSNYSANSDSTSNPSTIVALSSTSGSGGNSYMSFWVLPGNYYKVVTGGHTLAQWTEWY